MAGKKPPSPELLADLAKVLPEEGFKKSTPRTKRKAPQGPKKLPALGQTPESVQKYTATLAQLLEVGDIGTGAAKELTNVANTHLRAVNARLRREEMERLEAMLREARALRRDGLAYEEQCRKHKTEPMLGVWVEVELPDGRKAVTRAAK